MPMPDLQFPGAWPESPPLLPSRPSSDMDFRTPPLGDSLEEVHRPSSPSLSATRFAEKPPPLRIVVPPTEYCPFSTDLTLPITPLSLPTPVSSSCFTFSDMQELANQTMSVPPAPAPLLPACPQATDLASPTSSQFLLMPPTPRVEHMDAGTAVCVSPLSTPGAANGSSESGEPKGRNLPPWGISSSTWLSDLGGHTETDRVFRRNLLEIHSVDTDSSPVSTPALSPSAVTPSSQVSSVLVYNSPTTSATSPSSLPPCIMSPRPFSPARLVLKPTGTDTFPSALDSLQAWREGVTPGFPRSEEPRSPLSENVQCSPLVELVPETPIHPSPPPHQLDSHPFPTSFPRVSKPQAFIKHAKMLGGRVKRLVTRQSANKHRGSMDRGVNLRVITSQDSENGSVILITAPPPPYDVRPLVSHGPIGDEHARSRTVSEYSSAVQASTIEHSTTGIAGSGSRRGSRNPLRRFSFAALSTIKRF